MIYFFDMNIRKRTPPRGFLFDMDGTLLITTQSPDQSWQEVFRQFADNYDLSPDVLAQALRESYVAYKKDIENDREKQRRDRLDPFAVRQGLVESALAQTGREDSAGAAAMARAYDALREEHLQLAPHAIETLQTLRAHHKHLGLITNGNATYQRRKIKRHHLAYYFDCIFIEEEFGAAKSDPSIYLAALEQLHVTPQETWMIGDDLAFDIATPQHLGIFAIWFDPAGDGLPKDSTVHPDQSIHVLTELLELDGEGSPQSGTSG
jgi:putative hydrolase of the HAD superfamily